MYLLLTLQIYLDLSGKSKTKRQICWIANGSVDQLQPLRLCGPFPQPERAHDGPEQWTPTASMGMNEWLSQLQTVEMGHFLGENHPIWE